MSRVVAVVQARMSSQRLPGKVLAVLPGADDPNRSIVDWTVQRVRRSRVIDEVVVATSDQAADDALAEQCARTGTACFRGSLDDVLDRLYNAARAHDATTIVRVTADCPLIDPDVITSVVDAHLARGGEFTTNRLPPPATRTWPIGLDVEVASMTAFEQAWTKATERFEREHVMPYLYAEPGRFDVAVVDAPIDAGTVRWTIDTPADLDAVRQLVALAGAGITTGWREFLTVWQDNPRLAEVNAAVAQRTATDVDPRSS